MMPRLRRAWAVRREESTLAGRAGDLGWEDAPVTGTDPTPPSDLPAAGPVEPLEFDPIPDIRLIACDMDGTLLDDDDAIHDDFWPLIDALH